LKLEVFRIFFMALTSSSGDSEGNSVAMDTNSVKESTTRSVKLLAIGGPASSFWGLDPGTVRQPPLRINAECPAPRGLFCDKRLENWENIAVAGILKLLDVFEHLDITLPVSKNPVAKIALSKNLEHWQQCQHDIGRVLPSKGQGLTRASQEVIEILGAQEWPQYC
jgi:hypothetical protein